MRVALDDDVVYLKGAGLKGLGNELAVGFACGEAYFEGSLDADSVGEVDFLVIVWVELSEHGAKTLYPFVVEFLLQLLTQFGGGVGHKRYPVAEGLDVETAATDCYHIVVFLEEEVEFLQCVLLIGEDIVGSRDGA